MGNIVNYNVFHLNFTKTARINGYSSGFAKGYISSINSQILKFIFHVSKRQQTRKGFLINELQFYNWKIINYYKNWYLIISVRDNFIYNSFKITKQNQAPLDNWINKGNIRYIKFLRNTVFRFIFDTTTFKNIYKQTAELLHDFLFYLNYIFFRLPFILKIKERLYNFILFNFFFYKFFNIFNPKIIFYIGYEVIPSAFFVSLFISKKLIHRFSLGAIMWRSLTYLQQYFNKNLISGFKILVSGRVSRRDRAVYKWRRVGKQSLNTKFSAIDYFVRQVFMRFGVCSVKVWIQR